MDASAGQNPSAFHASAELTAMKNKLIAFAALALAAILISGCATSTETTTTTETTKKDRTKSSMYAR
jgi:ABC-type oligopeptide transport system substrate-binding subunit